MVSASADSDLYSPGDVVCATVVVRYDRRGNGDGDGDGEAGAELGARAAGLMRVDPAWLPSTYAALEIPGALRRRASSSSTSELSIFNGEVSAAVPTSENHGEAHLRATFRLPSSLPPTFSGAAVKFVYFIDFTLRAAGGREPISTRVR